MGACSSTQSDPTCGVSGLPAPGSTVYYTPGNCYPVEGEFQNNGNCTVSSCAKVYLYQGATLVTQCFAAPGFITGATDLQLDPGTAGTTVRCDVGPEADGYPYARGNLAAGVYSFLLPLYPGVTATNAFTIKHTPVYITSTPTETATATTTDTVVVTEPVFTTTTDPAQQTVTTPAATVPQTVTVTPASVTVTAADVTTQTCYSDAWTWKHKTITATQSCPQPQPCPTGKGKGKNASRRDIDDPPVDAPPAPLQRRANCATSYPVTGDGPATVTSFADPSVTTTTVTDPVNTVTTTTTITNTISRPPDPATTTVASGTRTDQVTVTLAPGTRTVTKHRTAKTTVGRTHTRTVTYTKKVTPSSCFQKPKKKGPRGRS